jgi:hypothetical protein
VSQPKNAADMNGKGVLRPELARHIIDRLGGPGEPPIWGFQHFSVGLGDTLTALRELLHGHVGEGWSTFKLVVGGYGTGKTHFLYHLRELAWELGFVTCYVSLRHDESPFHQLDLVWSALARGLSRPLTGEELLSGTEEGMEAFLKAWYARERARLEEALVPPKDLGAALEARARASVEGLENRNFAAAIRAAMKALHAERDDDFDEVLGWLDRAFDAHVHGRLGMRRPIDRRDAFPTIRSLVQWVRNLGHPGLVFLLDEAEQTPSLSTRQKDAILKNLREWIDLASDPRFRGVLTCYAVPNENLFEGSGDVYEALKQRIQTIFQFHNPSGVKLKLDDVEGDPLDQLRQIGKRVAGIFQIANGPLDPDAVAALVGRVAEEAHERRYVEVGHKRWFVQHLVAGMYELSRPAKK